MKPLERTAFQSRKALVLPPALSGSIIMHDHRLDVRYLHVDSRLMEIYTLLNEMGRLLRV